MFNKILISLIMIFVFSGCVYNKFNHIDYGDSEMKEKVLEHYSSELDKFDFDNLIQEGFKRRDKTVSGTLYVDYDLSLDIPTETFEDFCSISYMIKNRVFFYDMKFNKDDIVQMGRKKYYSELINCLDKNIDILKRRKRKILEKEMEVHQKLSEKI